MTLSFIAAAHESMLPRTFLASIMLLASWETAWALDYTDLWYVPAESGWGANVVQSGNFMFVSFFIYGQDKKPTWYTAQLTNNQQGAFTGALFATTGTYYGTTWNPPDVTVTQVGTASFQPTTAYTAKLTYAVTSAPAAVVVKNVQRQTLTAIDLTGTYFGGQSGAYSGCSSPSDNGPYTDAFNLQVTQMPNGNVTFQFGYLSGLSCTLSGALVQYGQIYSVSAANYSCSDGLVTTANISEVRATPLGIEGRLSAASVGGACREDATFGGTAH